MEMTFDEWYGHVTKRQLSAYKRYQVSPSDHQFLVLVYGEDRHNAITQAVRDTRNHSGGTFSEYLFRQNLKEDFHL